MHPLKMFADVVLSHNLDISRFTEYTSCLFLPYVRESVLTILRACFYTETTNLFPFIVRILFIIRYCVSRMKC